MDRTEKLIVGGVALVTIGAVVYLSYMNKSMRDANTQRIVDSVRRDMTDQSQVPEGIRTQTADSLSNSASGQYARRQRSQAEVYAESNGIPLADTSSAPTSFDRHV